MILCNDGHKKVYYNSDKCPVCEVMKELSLANIIIGELQEKITCHETIDELEKKIEDLRTKTYDPAD